MEFAAYENWLNIAQSFWRNILADLTRNARRAAEQTTKVLHISVVTAGALTMLWTRAGGVSGKDTRKRKQPALMRQSLAKPKLATASASNAIAFLALVSSLLALAACPGSLSFDYVPGGSGVGGSSGADSGAIATSCANAAALISSNCAGCHTNPPSAVFANLDLVSPGVEQRLVGQAASSAGMCLTKGNLLNKGTLPATGILIDKINFMQTCGGGMPSGAPAALPAADLACLQAWANGLVQTVGP